MLLGDGTGQFYRCRAEPSSQVALGSIPSRRFTGNPGWTWVDEGDNDAGLLLNNGDGQFVRAPGRPSARWAQPIGNQVGDFTETEDIAVDNVGSLDNQCASR